MDLNQKHKLLLQLIVQRLAAVLLQLQLVESHCLHVWLLCDSRHEHMEVQVTTIRQRSTLLSDLIATGQIGIEIVLPVEHGHGVDVARQCQSGFDSGLNAFRI